MRDVVTTAVPHIPWKFPWEPEPVWHLLLQYVDGDVVKVEAELVMLLPQQEGPHLIGREMSIWSLIG